MTKYQSLFVLATALCLSVACEVSKSENPLSPTLAGPIPGVNITAPKTLEPAGGILIAGNTQPLTLLLENSSTTGPRPLNYVFEVATDAGFTNKVFERDGIQPGDGGRTSLRLPDPLGSGRGYYWRAKAQDGANTSPYSSPATFTVYTPLAFDKPVTIAPANNEKVASVNPEFSFSNATRVGTPTSVGYIVEVSRSGSFAPLFAAWYLDERPGVSRLTAPTALPADTQLFWRVRAIDGGVEGPYSDAAVFRTPAPVAPTPGPGTGGGGTPAPGGGSCSGFATPLQIIECNRAKWGGMGHSELVAFLKSSASDLNKAGIAQGPFGILRKTSGAQCNGYSCDIICSGQGTSQKQWDTLADADPGGAQIPLWNGPHGYPGIRVDTCEIQ